jgi:hypothetical protein
MDKQEKIAKYIGEEILNVMKKVNKKHVLSSAWVVLFKDKEGRIITISGDTGFKLDDYYMNILPSMYNSLNERERFIRNESAKKTVKQGEALDDENVVQPKDLTYIR